MELRHRAGKRTPIVVYDIKHFSSLVLSHLTKGHILGIGCIKHAPSEKTGECLKASLRIAASTLTVILSCYG